jgi:hypothetical protein
VIVMNCASPLLVYGRLDALVGDTIVAQDGDAARFPLCGRLLAVASSEPHCGRTSQGQLTAHKRRATAPQHLALDPHSHAISDVVRAFPLFNRRHC